MLGFGGSGDPHSRGHSPFITLSSQFNRPVDELIPHEVPFAQVAEEGGSMEVLKRLERCPYGDVPESGGKAPADKLHEGLEGVLKIAPLVDYIHRCRVQPKEEIRETKAMEQTKETTKPNENTAAVNRHDAATFADPTKNHLRSRRGDEAEDNGRGTTSWNNTPKPAFDTMELERFVNMRIVDRRSSSSASFSFPGVPASSSELRFVPGSDLDTSHSANMLPKRSANGATNNGTHSTLHPTATTSPPPTSPSSPPITPSSHREAQKRARISSGEGFARSARRFTQHDVERHGYLGVRFTIPPPPRRASKRPSNHPHTSTDTERSGTRRQQRRQQRRRLSEQGAFEEGKEKEGGGGGDGDYSDSGTHTHGRRRRDRRILFVGLAPSRPLRITVDHHRPVNTGIAERQHFKLMIDRGAGLLYVRRYMDFNFDPITTVKPGDRYVVKKRAEKRAVHRVKR